MLIESDFFGNQSRTMLTECVFFQEQKSNVADREGFVQLPSNVVSPVILSVLSNCGVDTPFQK